MAAYMFYVGISSTISTTNDWVFLKQCMLSFTYSESKKYIHVYMENKCEA